VLCGLAKRRKIAIFLGFCGFWFCVGGWFFGWLDGLVESYDKIYI
jgi:hypothetical protein